MAGMLSHRDQGGAQSSASAPKPMASLAEERPQTSSSIYEHDLFISYSVNASKDTFTNLVQGFEMMGLNVFNPDMHMAVEGGASAELMAAHARGSNLMLAIITKDAPIITKSEWCRVEIAAAKQQGIPVIPIYNGEQSLLKDVKDVIDGKVAGLAKGSEHWHLVEYVFKEQIQELVSNPQGRAEAIKRCQAIAKRAQQR